MPRIRKTSIQPKRKPKKAEPIVEKVYPEFIENFKKQVTEKTPFTVKIDQYADKSPWHIGVLQKQGSVFRCIWMVNFATEKDHLDLFWKSETYKNWRDQSS